MTLTQEMPAARGGMSLSIGPISPRFARLAGHFPSSMAVFGVRCEGLPVFHPCSALCVAEEKWVNFP
jgi:hypothetical protein